MIGFKEVETYWNVYTHPADKLRKMIVDNGLSIHSGHFDYDGMATKFDYAKTLGVNYMICPMLPKDMWTSADGFKKAADQFNKWGPQAKSMGHAVRLSQPQLRVPEVRQRNGIRHPDHRAPIPKLVYLEMDCYWITQAGPGSCRHAKEIRQSHPVAALEKLRHVGLPDLGRCWVPMPGASPKSAPAPSTGRPYSRPRSRRV